MNEYTPLAERFYWEEDLSQEFMCLGQTVTGNVMMKIVAPEIPVPIIVDLETNSYTAAWFQAVSYFSKIGARETVYFNVTDPNDNLHVRIEDATGQAPWYAIIVNACFTGEETGELLLCKSHNTDCRATERSESGGYH